LNLNDLCKSDVASEPVMAVQELLRGLVVRTNLVPGVRHVLGWRGVKDASHGAEAWTMRIDGRRGVYGLVFDVMVEDGPWRRGLFNLCYFPHPEEELVEQVCVEASLVTARSGYVAEVRDFAVHEHLLDLFNIGTLELALHTGGQAVSVRLESVTRQQVTATHGVTLEQDGQALTLVPPGGLDQDFPAWAVSLDLLRVLAASLSFNLQRPPTALTSAEQPGWVRAYDRDGGMREDETPDNPQRQLSLVYGLDAGPPAAGWQLREDGDGEFADEAWWSAHRIGDFKAVDKHALGIDERPQLIVVTGFLGSGKTTFLQNFIDHMNRNNRFVAVIQNEVGEVGLDGGLLDHDYAVTEIDEGCICCTLVGNVKAALGQIMGEFHPDYIVLETTGLANPLNLLDELAEVAEMVRFDSVTTLVDGANLAASLTHTTVARDQIRAADVVLLNKADLLDDTELGAVQEVIAGINGVAPIVPTIRGDINPALLYGEETATPAMIGAEHGPDHRHDHFHTCKLTFDEPLPAARLERALDHMPAAVFRVKGVVRLAERSQPQVVQYVAGRYELSEHPNGEDAEADYLVCIGRDLDQGELAQLFDRD